MAFYSDNAVPAHPAVIEALAAANATPRPAYGDDPLTAGLTARFAEIFETDRLAVVTLSTGTAANCLGLSLLCPPYGGILCHRDAHIVQDELTGPELFTGGARLLPQDGADAKLDAATLAGLLDRWPGHGVHSVTPTTLALTQASEMGTVYSVAEIEALGALCRDRGLGLYMDGARFANAVVATGASPAALTWQAGVQALSFGATKNGCLNAEALVVFDPTLAERLAFARKRSGHLVSKNWTLSAQLHAYLTDGLWHDNARHANRAAADLAAGLEGLPGVRLLGPVQANEIFIRLPETLRTAWRAAGIDGYDWPPLGPGAVRLVTAWCSDPALVDRALTLARETLS